MEQPGQLEGALHLALLLLLQIGPQGVEQRPGVAVPLAAQLLEPWPEPGEQLSCATALLRFLDFRAASGVVCSEVREVRCVYELQSNSAALRLHPLWQIDTDTYRYFVDCATGAVTRQ